MMDMGLSSSRKHDLIEQDAPYVEESKVNLLDQANKDIASKVDMISEKIQSFESQNQGNRHFMAQTVN